MEAAKERRSPSLLPPLNYETLNTFFEAKKQQHTHIRLIFTTTAHAHLYMRQIFTKTTHTTEHTHTVLKYDYLRTMQRLVQRCRYAKSRYLRYLTI